MSATILLAAAAAGVVALRLLLGRDASGAVTIGIVEGTRLDLRGAAAGAAALAGGALGLAGFLLQVLLRNPLAAPSVLGVTSGAALGVSVVALVPFAGGALQAESAVASASMETAELLGAAGGALLSLTVIFAMARRRGGIDPVSVVLAGVVLSALLGAVAMGLQWALPPHSRAEVSLWMMGRIPESLQKGVAWTAGVTLAVAAGFGCRRSTAMDVSLAGDAEARSLGLRLGALRWQLLAVAGALTGCAVALCGPIAFVGFVAPHLARSMLGPRARHLVLGSILCGAIVLVGADVARIVIPTSYGRLPVGVVTAVVGGLWFLRYLSRGREAWS